jgi:hypothetical protein
MKLSVLALICLLIPVLLQAKEKQPTTYTIPLPPRPDFTALDWLVGEWAGKTTGHSPQGEFHLAVSYDLDKRFMVFREEISLTATNAVPATKESWMGILFASRGGAAFLLRIFSSTGFITLCRVTVDGGEIRLDPEGGDQPPPGLLFRRVFERSGDGEVNETVQVAPPDKPFFEYYTAKFTHTPRR